MKLQGRKQSKNISRDTPKTRGQEMLAQQQRNRDLAKFAEATRAIPQDVNDMMDRAHMNDIINRQKKARIPRSAR